MKKSRPEKSLHLVALLLLISEVGLLALLSPAQLKTLLLFGGGLGLAMVFDFGGLLLSLPLLFPLLMGHGHHTPYIWGGLFLVQGFLALSIRRSMRSVDELLRRPALIEEKAALPQEELKEMKQLQGQCVHLSQQLQEQKNELLTCRRELFRLEGEIALREKQKLLEGLDKHEVVHHFAEIESENLRLHQEITDLERLIKELSKSHDHHP